MYLSDVKIEPGKRIRIRARLSIEGGELLEDRVVEYVQGDGSMLPGLEKRLGGLESGAELKGTIPPAEAFGNDDATPAMTISKAEFPKDASFEIGSTFVAKGANGQDVQLVVKKVTEKEIEVKLRHPLADKTIAYDVTVLAVSVPPPPPPPGALGKKA